MDSNSEILEVVEDEAKIRGKSKIHLFAGIFVDWISCWVSIVVDLAQGGSWRPCLDSGGGYFCRGTEEEEAKESVHMTLVNIKSFNIELLSQRCRISQHFEVRTKLFFFYKKQLPNQHSVS